MKKMFLFGFVFLLLGACQQTGKKGDSSSSKKDTNVIHLKSKKDKKVLPEKNNVVIAPSQKTEYSVDSFFSDINFIYKEGILNDSTNAEEGVEKHFVLNKNEEDSITQTLFVRTKASDEDSVIKDRYFVWYSYQNTMSSVDTAQDIYIMLFKDSLGKAKYVQITFDQYLIQDSLKESKNALFPPSSFELKNDDLQKMFVLFKKK